MWFRLFLSCIILIMRKTLTALLALALISSCSSPSGTYRTISSDEARKELAGCDECIIVDVREIDEYEEVHIKGAINVPLSTIDDKRPEELPDLNAKIYIYCRSGRRSAEASEKLANMGYTDITDFGGILDWKGETE